MFKLNPNERLLIERGLNNYKLVGPGRIWLAPWHKVLARLYVGPQGQTLQINGVRTAEDVPVDVTLQFTYQIEPELLGPALLPKLPGLDDGGWSGLISWRTEHVLRQMLADHSWRTLSQAAIQQRLERRLTHTLADLLQMVGLKVLAVCLIEVALPPKLQRAIVQAERDGVEPRGRAAVLKQYFEIFGDDLAQAMPYIVQWELLNVLRKNDPQLLLTSSALSPDNLTALGKGLPGFYQMSLPLIPNN